MPVKYTHEQRRAKFWEKVYIPSLLACWVWQGYKNPQGYGQLHVADRRQVRAHRMAWEIVYGPIPKGLHCLHKCDNPSCVNPSHLYIGTNLDNVRDRMNRNRQSYTKGEKNGKSKLTDDKVKEIRDLLKAGHTQQSVANQFNVSRPLIGYIKRGVIWKHLKQHQTEGRSCQIVQSH